jgi:hypothetical protein
MSTRKSTGAAAKAVKKAGSAAPKKGVAKKTTATKPAAKKVAPGKTVVAKTAAKKTVVGKSPKKRPTVAAAPEAVTKVYPTGVPKRLFGTSNYDPVEEDDDFTHRVTYALKHPDGHLMRMRVASITDRAGAYILTGETSAFRVFELNTLDEMREYLKNYRTATPQRGDWNWPATVENLSKYQVVCRTFRNGHETIEAVTDETPVPESKHTTTVSYGLVSPDGRVMHWHLAYFAKRKCFGAILQPEGSPELKAPDLVDFASLDELLESMKGEQKWWDRWAEGKSNRPRMKSQSNLVDPSQCRVIRRTTVTTVTEELL